MQQFDILQSCCLSEKFWGGFDKILEKKRLKNFGYFIWRWLSERKKVNPPPHPPTIALCHNKICPNSLSSAFTYLEYNRKTTMNVCVEQLIVSDRVYLWGLISLSVIRGPTNEIWYNYLFNTRVWLYFIIHCI